MTSDNTIDVLVVGAGPTGVALAVDLARRGLNIKIVDKAAHVFDGSRAKGLQPRTLEVLADLGVLDDIVAGGGDYPLLGIHLGPVTLPWRMIRRSRPTDDIPYPNTWLIPQFRTDRALHDRLADLGHRPAFDRELVEITQDDTAATALLAGPDGMEKVTARYVVGADGGASAVRKQVGIGFLGSTDEADRMLIVDAATTGLSRDRWHIWPGRGGRFVGACPLPHSTLYQWMIRLTPDEEPPLDEDQITDRIRAHTRNRRITVSDIQWKSVFRPNIRLAEHYRQGRVFIAGDAAHVHTPAGGQGLNTGIQDAYNLGWKLAQVLAGAGSQLLDSYETERLPIAAGVLGLSTKKYEGMAKLDPSSIRRGKDEQQLQLSYHGGPLAPASGDRTKTLRTGDRAPDANLRGPDGGLTRLFDAYRGAHFTGIAYGASAARALDGLDWPSVGAPLKRIVVDGDATESLRKAYGLTDDTLLLIRPDGYVGHIARRDILASTQAFATQLAPLSESSA
jgi:2-polyprenyl-6-methoxyphenol hydroxylase-like FAD-dependent oxidoreductase